MALFGAARKPRILLTNDDGIDATGLQVVRESLSEHADIYVVAPAFDQSGRGGAITIDDHLFIERTDYAQGWRVHGTPADCVKMALGELLGFVPDLVLAGINHGHNNGRNVLHSGTVSTACVAAHRGIPAMALSSMGSDHPDLAAAAQWVPELVDYLLHHPLRAGSLLNVNFPGNAHAMKGVKMTKQSLELWHEDPSLVKMQEEGHYYFMGGKIVKFDEHHDSEVPWLEKGYATVSPIHVGDLSDHDYIHGHRDKIEKHIEKRRGQKV